MLMSFLKCNPNIFVINNEYEILIFLKEKGICFIEVAGQYFYEENSGVLSSEKNYVKIRVPQQLLDSNESYKVIFKQTINRKAYFSELGLEQEKTFSFKPMKKEENINVYHIADVHYRFELAKKTVSYFGDDLDLLIVNGDIGEVELFEDYFNVANFIGEISQGMIPIIFARGNHDTRGKMAELYTDIFPANGKNTFFTFNIGNLSGVVLDCGEDKLDNHEEYSGVNRFEVFRLKETEFLKNINLNDRSIKLAISHICPMQTTLTSGNIFDINRDIYSIWNDELDRLGINFMLCGHMHEAYLLEKDSPNALIANHFPVIVGSYVSSDDIYGCALTIFKDYVICRFTNKDKEIKKEFVLKF